VPLRGPHGLAALRGDHTGLHAPFGHRPGEAVAYTLGEIQALALLAQVENLSKKRKK
jgi:hypothetical protein